MNAGVAGREELCQEGCLPVQQLACLLGKFIVA